MVKIGPFLQYCDKEMEKNLPFLAILWLKKKVKISPFCARHSDTKNGQNLQFVCADRAACMPLRTWHTQQLELTRQRLCVSSLSAGRCVASAERATCRPWSWRPTFSLSSSSCSSRSWPSAWPAGPWPPSGSLSPSPCTRLSGYPSPSSCPSRYRTLPRCAFASNGCRYVATFTLSFVAASECNSLVVSVYA